jgi:hypothetical protein
MLNNMLAARAIVAERRHQYESEAENHRLRLLDRVVRHADGRRVRRERLPVYRLRARHA